MQCSTSCGKGWRSRKIECQFSTGKPSSLCDLEKRPDYYEECEANDCPKWDTAEWSPCSSECGQGFRRRLVVCRNSEGLILGDDNCNMSEKPTETEPCIGNSCARWKTENWSEVMFIILSTKEL